jgi:mRNA-degrading endonuclease RelE of RelBE toxin-antitoxin system
MANQRSESQDDNPQNAASAVYEVLLTATAEAAYSKYFEAAQRAISRGDLTNAHCTTLRQIDDALENMIPHDPLNARYALAGDLRPIFRLRKGRLRICWIGSADQRRVYVLFIAETLRKAGDVNDPYKILTKMVKNGTYNQFFKQLGITPPPIAPSYRIQ